MGTRLQLRAAFGAIAALFAALAGCMMWRAYSVRSETRSLVGEMLESVELVSRIGRDIARQRRLIDSHIFLKTPAEMGRLEEELAAARADYIQSAARYAELPQLPEEAALWVRLQGEIESLNGPLDVAMGFSRMQRNEEARQTMETLLPRYHAIDDLLAGLIRTNRAAAEETLQRVERLQATTMWTIGLLSLFGIALSLTVGVAVSRRVASQALLLEAQNRELDAFAGRVAHDLRGPLTSLQLAAGTFERSPVRGQQQMTRSIERMTTLINDLLAFSRAEGAGSCDPAATVEQLREDMSPRLEQDGVQLAVEVESAEVNCAGGLLRQVLWNLIDNAVKYHREGVPPEVDIQGHVRNGGYHLVVRDNGMGMSADEVRHAFDPFYRGHRVRTIAGTGLGLALVKRVLEAAGGRVAIESQPGQGTAFVIQVPRAV